MSDIASLITKVNNIENRLTANQKQFVFAYENNQYGYKAGADGEFNSFEKTTNHIGKLFPYELASTEGITFSNCSLVEGGYYIENGKCYFDMLIEITTRTNQAVILNIPSHSSYAIYFLRFFGDNDAGSMFTNSLNLDADTYVDVGTRIRYVSIYKL